MPIAFLIFFTLSAVRGYVQPQWVIASTFGLVWILFAYVRCHVRTRRYVINMGLLTIILIGIVRLVLVFNPIGMKMEVFYNHENYGRIAGVAEGRPVIFDEGYTDAAKYLLYGQGEAYGTQNIAARSHQWQFRSDSLFNGRDVVAEVQGIPQEEIDGSQGLYHEVVLRNGHKFVYVIIPDYHSFVS